MKRAGEIILEGSRTALWKIYDFFSVFQGGRLESVCSPSFSCGNDTLIAKISIGHPFENPLENWIRLEISSKNNRDCIRRCGIRKEDGESYCSVYKEAFYLGDAYLMTVGDFFSKALEFAAQRHVTFFMEFSNGNHPSCTKFPATTPTSNAKDEPKTEIKDLGVLSQNLEDLYLKGWKTDMTFQVGDRIFKVHKAILGARSEVFAAMIEHDERENVEMVDVVDCNADDFHNLMLYLYSGKVEKLTVNKTISLYTLADKYIVDGLKSKCIDRLKENITENFYFDVIEIAVKHDDSKLLELCKTFFRDNAKNILLTPPWQTFMKENTEFANELLLLTLYDRF